MQWSANGRHLLFADVGRRTPCIYDCQDDRYVNFDGDHPGWTAAMSPDAKLLTVAREDELVQFLGVETREVLAEFRLGGTPRVAALDHSWAVYALDSRAVAVRIADLHVVPYPNALDVKRIVFVEEDRVLLECPERQIWSWDLLENHAELMFADYACSAVSADDRLLALGFEDGRIELWAWWHRVKLSEALGPPHPVQLALSFDGFRLLSTHKGSLKHFWQMDCPIADLAGEWARMERLSAHPDPELAAVGRFLEPILITLHRHSVRLDDGGPDRAGPDIELE